MTVKRALNAALVAGDTVAVCQAVASILTDRRRALLRSCLRSRGAACNCGRGSARGPHWTRGGRAAEPIGQGAGRRHGLRALREKVIVVTSRARVAAECVNGAPARIGSQTRVAKVLTGIRDALAVVRVLPPAHVSGHAVAVSTAVPSVLANRI